jgi:hypothetical protein
MGARLRGYLGPLLAKAAQKLPASAASVEVGLYATAGVRLLSQPERSRLMGAISEVLAQECSYVLNSPLFDLICKHTHTHTHTQKKKKKKNSPIQLQFHSIPFHSPLSPTPPLPPHSRLSDAHRSFELGDVEVIVGQAEGLLAWIAANYAAAGPAMMPRGPGARARGAGFRLPAAAVRADNDDAALGEFEGMDVACPHKTYAACDVPPCSEVRAAPSVPLPTLPIMDLGGASTQVAFAVDKCALERGNAFLGVAYGTVPSGERHSVVSASYLGFGKSRAHDRLLRHILDSGAAGTDRVNPCFPVGYVEAGVRGTSDFAACQQLVDEVLVPAIRALKTTSLPDTSELAGIVGFDNFMYV